MSNGDERLELWQTRLSSAFWGQNKKRENYFLFFSSASCCRMCQRQLNVGFAGSTREAPKGLPFEAGPPHCQACTSVWGFIYSFGSGSFPHPPPRCLKIFLCLPLFLGKCLISPRRAQGLVSTQGLETRGWTCQQAPATQTPARAGLVGIRQQFPPNSQADCRHLCCQQNCRKCNSCC